MSFIGNVLWFIFAGLWQGLAWFTVGLLWCLTIVGIPIGVQCFKFVGLSFFPFGKRVVNEGGLGSCLLNVLWLIFGGFLIALIDVITGVLLCLTIIGIPFGLQCFKHARLAFAPFGARIISD